MPTKVGETLTFYMYESFYNGDRSKCKAFQRRFKSKATLCSPDGDYVYLLVGKMTAGYDTICGMFKN